MLSKIFLKPLVLSFVIIGALVFLLSCENPFANNMGSKVDFSPPTIDVHEPKPTSYISGNTTFRGSASAYRELRTVEVMIVGNNRTLPWTSAGITLFGPDKNKTWEYTLDTTTKNSLFKGDGQVIIQFRATDTSLTTETVKLPYMIKNDPSDIRLHTPDLPVNSWETGLQTGDEITGLIWDLRAIKPGYPQIKIWPEDLPGGEPADNDPNWGWVAMFISGLDDPMGDSGQGSYYTNRYNDEILPAAQFSFKLDTFEIEEYSGADWPTWADPLRKAVYKVEGGEHVPLPKGKYHFKIKTSDIFYDKATLRPREPAADETEKVAFFPPTGASSDVVTLTLNTSEAMPVFQLDNTDLADQSILSKKPHHYIDEPATTKIHRAINNRELFRLRVLITHPDEEIDWTNVKLTYMHRTVAPTTNTNLAWDNPGGTWKNSGSYSEGKYFVFTGRYTTTSPFRHSTEPYTLTVTAAPVGGSLTSTGSQSYILYLDGEGPRVNILSVQGATETPSGTPVTDSGGWRMDSLYEVNDNIQVNIDRFDDRGGIQPHRNTTVAKILEYDDDYPLVKWFVGEGPNYATHDIYTKLKAYYDNPTHDGLAFFHQATDDRDLRQGWVTRADGGGTHRFKLNTYKGDGEDVNDVPGTAFNEWNGKEHWLYIIAEDTAQNLGFLMQKIKIDDDGDNLKLTTSLSLSNAGGIMIGDDPTELDVEIGTSGTPTGGNYNTGTHRKNNILERDDVIELNFSDDDGINLSKGDVIIDLYDLNGDTSTVPHRVTNTNITSRLSDLNVRDGVGKDWSGSLTQALMATTLGKPTLPDGMYGIRIQARDDLASKTSITPWAIYNDTPALSTVDEYYIFAVAAQPQTVEFNNVEPPPLSLQSENVPVTISGEARSLLDVRQLRITFDPGVTVDGVLVSSQWLDLTDKRKVDNYFVYNWEIENVSFYNAGLSEQRERWDFTVEAFDRLGYSSTFTREIRVDSTPPEIDIPNFNNGRLGNMYGKVSFRISVQEDNGIKRYPASASDTNKNQHVGVWWWLLPKDEPAPTVTDGVPSDATGGGVSGGFRSGDTAHILGGGIYTGMINTRNLANNVQYVFWVIAIDEAGNKAVKSFGEATDLNYPPERFRVNQDADKPELKDGDPNPKDNVVQGAVGLSISGTAIDADGFKRTKLSSTPVPPGTTGINSYVQIRFPVSPWNTTDGSVGTGGWSPWINVPGTADVTPNEIRFNFVVNETHRYANGNTINPWTTPYFASDGTKHYQIRVTDERDYVEGSGALGKNPDGVTTGTGAIPAESKIFPSDTGSYSFVLDRRAPDVVFANPPDETFRSLDAMLLKSTGYVDEPNLRSVTFIYRTERTTITDFGSYNESYNFAFTATPAYLELFKTAGQGRQSITIEAVDTAGNRTSASWVFIKDSQGPEITLLDGIVRVIQHAELPALTEFPSNWPSDWPFGTEWESWDDDWKAIVQHWPSAYAFLASPNAVIDALRRDMYVTGTTARKPSVISGEVGNLTISGSFRDTTSSMWVAGSTSPMFSYRFDSSDGRTNPPWSLSFPIIPDPDGDTQIANWVIPIPNTLPDGPHTLDIRITDTIDNVADVYGLCFIVDSKAPELTEFVVGGAVMDDTEGSLAENLRVFSASSVGQNSTGIVFTLKGTVSDNNLSELSSVIKSSSASYSSVEVKLEVPEWTAVANAQSTDTEHRLKITAAATEHDWDWTFDVLQKDVWNLDHQSSDGTRHTVEVLAADLARRNTVKQWDFRLDSTKPVIEYNNLETGTTIFESAASEITLRGFVSDDTGIQNIRFLIRKWDYQTSAWQWYNGTTWVTPDVPGPADWASLLNISGSGDPLYTDQNADLLVSWTLNQARLNLIATESGKYPQNLFDTEGQYKLDLYVTDRSLAFGAADDAGNPHNTIDNAANSRLFFIDRDYPKVTFTGDESKIYYNDAALTNTGFTFTIEDNNTISNTVTAAVRQGTTPVVPSFDITPNGNSHDTVRTMTVKPTMPSNASSDTYTLVVTVTDGAGKSSISTRQFTLDNQPPAFGSFTPSTDPVSGRVPAIAGKVVIEGNTTENNNVFSKVAYYVANKDHNWNAPSYTGNSTDGWHYYDEDDTLLALIADTSLSEAPLPTNALFAKGRGDPSWKLDLSNTRRIISEDDQNPALYTRKMTAGSAGVPPLSFTDTSTGITHNIDSSEIVHRLDIYFLAEDQAGNIGYTLKTYWIYPEGDRPTAVINTPSNLKPDAERTMNGPIRVSGMAYDNEQVRQVWIRVLNASNTPVNLRIPKWKYDAVTNTWVADTGYQETPATITRPGETNPTGGWYIANGGGSRTVSWWAEINTAGELEETEITRITIEVCAEDSIFESWNSSLSDKWTTQGNMFSKKSDEQSVVAFVVADAPIFEDELLTVGTSAAANWSSYTSINTSGRSAYRITVKSVAGIGSIRYSPTTNSLGEDTASMVNLLDETALYNTTTYSSDLNGMDDSPQYGKGIAVKAGPKAVRTSLGNGDNNKTFFIWKPDSSLIGTPIVGGDGNLTLTADDVKRNTVFTYRGNAVRNGNFQLIEQTVDGYFEWIVTVDLDGKMVAGGAYATESERFPVYLTATDVSLNTPLSSVRTVYIPIDNKAPHGEYSLQTNLVGSAATVGGEAGDAGNVNGVQKVVFWFSRRINSTDTLISWHENGATALPLTTTNQWVTHGDGSQPSNISMPVIPAENAGTGGSYAIVIDRNDPAGNQSHHGHKLPVSLSSGGGLGWVWYAEIDSTAITSGPVTMHYVVFDRAGNATYYTKTLMVMNRAPAISRIRLGTDILGDNNRQAHSPPRPTLSAALGAGTGNVHLASGSQALADTFLGKMLYNSAPTNDSFYGDSSNELTSGISPWVRVSGTNPVLSVSDFNVRNALLALRVETTQEPSANKDRNFRLEYVSGAAQITGLNSIKKGRVYIIENPNIRWGALGAKGSSWERGDAFLANDDGPATSGLGWDGTTTTTLAWELNSSYYSSVPPTVPQALGFGTNRDVVYGATATGNEDAVDAEFAYRPGAFGTSTGNNRTNISDFVDSAYPPAAGLNPAERNSLFIIKVFDGDEGDVFADFVLLNIKVNNNDKTLPYSQLYDLNPLTEGQTRAQSRAQSLTPMSIGGNRTKGGLWNDDATARSIVKLGHIEPRRTTNTSTGTVHHPSLTSIQMGGTTNTKPGDQNQIGRYANPIGFFDVDTVSGQVVLRGYVEDDQRIDNVKLVFNTTTVTILDKATTAAPTSLNTATATSATTGLLKVAGNTTNNPTDGRVYYTDTIDLYRHRVEWAYVWDTETMPGGTNIVGSVTVQVNAYNANSTPQQSAQRSETTSNLPENVAAVSNNNPGFPTTTAVAGGSGSINATLSKYNSIQINVRPYITGFLRNQSAFYHNTRSLQGWYAFSRGEGVVVSGFNLGRATGTGQNTYTRITLQQSGTTPTINMDATVPTATANTGQVATHGATANAAHHLYFTVGATTGTNNVRQGPVTLTTGTINTTTTYPAVNNSPDRRKLNAAGTAVDTTTGRYWIQPWNWEYDAGKDGSDLWDDVTSVHIWQSNDTTTGSDHGSFPTKRSTTTTPVQPWTILDPAMTIDPRDGILYASQNEPGAGQGVPNGTGYTSTTFVSSNTNNSSSNGRMSRQVMGFVDPIINSDIYFSLGDGTTSATTGPSYYAVSSIIGRNGTTGQGWGDLGGIYIFGPGGTDPGFLPVQGNNSSGHLLDNNIAGTIPTTYAPPTLYYGESTYYNASSGTPGAQYDPPTTDQFANPHIVTARVGTTEHIHVSYYDTKDGSIKYSYNQRNNPGTITTTAAQRRWVNLDGSFDADDLTSATGAAETTPTRVVDYAGRRQGATTNPRPGLPDVGRHNAIAVTVQGHPVIAYYDQTNQWLKLAVSNSATPTLATNWEIFKVIPDSDLSQLGTGQYVSIRIDTTTTPSNTVHIAAFNSVNKRLVYIKGTVNSASRTYTTSTVRVVDSVGDVGRWCTISLDEDGNPWIAYQDESYNGSMDGVKMAYYNGSAFFKELPDIYGESIRGWETMHVPAQYRVNNARVGLECYPTRNVAPANSNNTRIWKAAVSFLTPDLYRIAYYVK